MPGPLVGLVLRGVAGTALKGVARGAARGAMTTARFGLKGGKGVAGMAANAAISSSLSSSQFSGTSPSVNITGPAVHETLGKSPQ
jgi:hypothetical protein